MSIKHITTKENIKMLIDLYPKFETKKLVDEAMQKEGGTPQGWSYRMIPLLRKAGVDMPKKVTVKVRLADLIAEVLAGK